MTFATTFTAPLMLLFTALLARAWSRFSGPVPRGYRCWLLCRVPVTGLLLAALAVLTAGGLRAQGKPVISAITPNHAALGSTVRVTITG